MMLRVRQLIRRWRGNQEGVAAIEFALIAPILIIFHLGSVELVDAWEANRRAAHIAAALADIVAQNRTVSDADLTDILQAGPLLMQPYPAANLGERVASVSANSWGNITVDWTATRNWTQGGQASVPNSYLAAGESVIVADVTYTHTAIFALVLPQTFTIQKHAYLRPRLSTQVAKV
jgi:Flp pilus assembly protein TadG